MLASRPILEPHEAGFSFRQAAGLGIHLIASEC